MILKSLWRGLPLAAAIATLTCTAMGVQASPSDRCDTQSIQSMAPPHTTIAFASRVFGGECRVNGYVTTNDPTPNNVNFVLNLPDRFNGRYVYLGVGGAAGRLPAIPPELVAQGYALAGSDGGTGAKSNSDFSFKSDPAKATDFLWRGVQVSAQATQTITRAYYGKNDIHRYISGCSGGGQMGLGNARRFGRDDFDGFLVGATPWPANLYHANVFRIASHLQNNPEGWIPPELVERVYGAILEAYDATDGSLDGIIRDERDIESFDLSLLREQGFSPQQIETFELIRQPFTFPATGLGGDGVHPGFPVTSLPAWPHFLLGLTPPPWPDTDTVSPGDLRGKAPFIHIMSDTRTRAAYPGKDYSAIEDLEQLVRISTRDGEDIPFEDPMDFGKLSKSGAKMIVWHGVNDEAMSYLESLAGAQALWKRFPDSRDWLGYYTIPGLLHCRGGVGPTEVDFTSRLLEELVAWVEKDEAPGPVVAGRYSKEKGLEREFKLCPEPYRAHLKKSNLDPIDVNNWQCSDENGTPL